jgi:hypothetical protein
MTTWNRAQAAPACKPCAAQSATATRAVAPDRAQVEPRQAHGDGGETRSDERPPASSAHDVNRETDGYSNNDEQAHATDDNHEGLLALKLAVFVVHPLTMHAEEAVA